MNFSFPHACTFPHSELNKVYTNGTLVDPELLTDDHAGHCISLREEPPEDGKNKDSDTRMFGVCVLDSSTSEFGLSAFEDDVCRTRLETLLRQLRVKEVVFTKVSLNAPPLLMRPDACTCRVIYLWGQRGF
jgi:DNA mismatch repair protein MSH6